MCWCCCCCMFTAGRCIITWPGPPCIFCCMGSCIMTPGPGCPIILTGPPPTFCICCCCCCGDGKRGGWEPSTCGCPSGPWGSDADCADMFLAKSFFLCLFFLVYAFFFVFDYNPNVSFFFYPLLEFIEATFFHNSGTKQQTNSKKSTATFARLLSSARRRAYTGLNNDYRRQFS